MISKISTSLVLALLMSMQNFKITRLKDLLLAGLVIGLPMLIIVAESETGSALVYVGFILVLYREGLSGWWLGALGLVIALFISTLTLGAFWACILLITVLTLAVAAMSRDFWPRLYSGWGFVGVMAFLPRLCHGIGSRVQRHMEWIATRV